MKSPTGKTKRRVGNNGSSTNTEKNHVDKPGFWKNPQNHFWNSGAYSETSKQYFRTFLRDSSMSKALIILIVCLAMLISICCDAWLEKKRRTQLIEELEARHFNNSYDITFPIEDSLRAEAKKWKDVATLNHITIERLNNSVRDLQQEIDRLKKNGQ